MCRIRLLVRNRRLTIKAITRFIRRSLLSATSRSGSVVGEQVNRKDQCVAALDLVVAFLTVRVFGRAYQDHATADLLVDQKVVPALDKASGNDRRSEEQTSEIQSRGHHVIRLRLEKIKACNVRTVHC